MDWLSPVRRAARRAPSVRVNSPVLARYLDDLARQDQLAGEWDALAAAARGMDDALPPRGPVPPGDFNVAIEGMMPDSPPMPVADMLFGNDRTRALVNSRLDRLTPEQQVGSLGIVGRQADADAAMRRKQDIESDMDLGTRLGLAAGAAALAGGFALKRGDDAKAEAVKAELARRRARDEVIDSRLQGDVDAISIEGPEGPGVFYESPDFDALMQEAMDSSGEGLDRMRRDRQDRERVLLDALSGNPDGAMPMTIDIGEDSPISGFDPLADMADAAGLPMPLSDDLLYESAALPSVQGMLQDSAVVARNLPKFPMDGSFQRLLESGVYQLPSPEDTTEMSPGPESPVGMNRDLEDLPGPQMRSVRALMAAGIPEGRAMAIIVKGSSMSQDEYRMVTGGRR